MQQVGGEVELFLVSLDQMKKASKGELFENAVTHRGYAFWMLGVLTDHDMRCYSNAVIWTEMLLRSFGNDLDLFGFILLGAYQDARPEKLRLHDDGSTQRVLNAPLQFAGSVSTDRVDTLRFRLDCALCVHAQVLGVGTDPPVLQVRGP